jgi:hypothetical protein
VFDRRAFDVVLVGDLADDLLEDVLDGDQACRATVLVDDDHEVGAGRLHLGEQVVDGFRLGHERRGPHQVGHRLRRRGGVAVLGAADHVFQVEDAQDVVDAVPYHRDA